MTTIDPSVVANLRKTGLLREGHFAFRSGRHSGGLIDRDLLLADPGFASHLGYILAKRFFTDHVETVAAPSIWGAGLAQWVGYFLEPKAKIVYATPTSGSLTIAANLADQIRGRRVLIVDNLFMTGETMHRFVPAIDALGATVVGVGVLWSAGGAVIDGHPVWSVLNGMYETYPAEACPICLAHGAPPENVPY